MRASTKKTCCIAATLAAASFCAASALAQQPLSLSYNLDVRSDPVQSAPSLVNRCSGFQWVGSIGTCGRELLASIGPAAERLTKSVVTAVPGEGEGATTHAAAPVEVGPTRLEPAESASAAEPRYRGLPGRETLIGSRTADLLLRLGSMYRFRNNEEAGWDSHRFTDTTYQSHLQNKGYKALGLELHVPFQ